MLIVLTPDSTAQDADRVVSVARSLGFAAFAEMLRDRRVICLSGGAKGQDCAPFEALPGVARAVPLARALPHAARLDDDATLAVPVGPVTVGGGQPTLIAGPCAVESEEQLLPLARRIRDAGVDLLRGGAFKPRSSPYEFQGLGRRGLELLALAREETGLAVVTEAVDEASFDLVERYADMAQIGARNMQNFALLRRAGRSNLPILLKRGFAADLDELLAAAEYVMHAGNPRVVLCERGIRTFASHSRFTLDLAILPQIRRASRLPVVVDPSHASGVRESVAPLARAALAAGADGVMLEVHADPERARCDGRQSLTPGELAPLVGELRALAGLIGRPRETVA